MIDLRRSSRARPHHLRWCIALLIGAVALATWTPNAHAQINPFRGYKGPSLSKEDIAAGRTAAGKLLSDDKAEIGKSEDWTGPTSGNQGTISVLRAFRRKDMDCRALRSEIRYKKSPASPRTTNLNVCRLQNGEWKIL